MPSSLNSLGNQLLLIDVKDFGAIGDGVVEDATAISSAIAAAQARGGGMVYFPAGTYAVTSTSRLDTISAVNGTVFSDTSCVAGDVGAYCIGDNIDGKIPKIVSVNPGVSFTVDVAPESTPTSIYIVKPGFVLPEGIQICGEGATFTTNGFGAGNSSTSKILDKGTGVTCLIRGSGSSTGNASSRYAIKDLSVWGNNNTNLYGLYASNMAWFITIENCDFSGHGVAGAVFDGNINSHDVRSTIFSRNGTAAASSYTGGVITHLFWAEPSSSLNFYNCFFNSNYGWGICNASGTGAFSVNLFGCQFNNTLTTNASNSGVSAMLRTVSMGSSNIFGCWSESAELYDFYLTGPVLIQGTQIKSVTNYAIHIAGGSLTLINCFLSNHTTASLELGSGANVNWINTTVEDPYFFSGGPANTPILGMGSTYGLTGSGTGISPGSFGASASNSLWQGSGAPSNSNGGNGDIYFRTDTPGSANQRLYIKSAGTLTGIL